MNKMDLDFDRNHIWHPYTSTLSPLNCYPVSHAAGNQIHLESGEILTGSLRGGQPFMVTTIPG
jgi:adenosylmethionine-8-amino-7-oxononanoate aminotransferase